MSGVSGEWSQTGQTPGSLSRQLPHIDCSQQGNLTARRARSLHIVHRSLTGISGSGMELMASVLLMRRGDCKQMLSSSAAQLLWGRIEGSMERENSCLVESDLTRLTRLEFQPSGRQRESFSNEKGIRWICIMISTLYAQHRGLTRAIL